MEDKTEFDQLFKQYYPQLYYYAFSFVNNIETSKDIASDAFESVWQNFSQINKGTVTAYLYTFVRNKCIDYLRHQNIHEQYVELYTDITQHYVEQEYNEMDEKVASIRKAMLKLTPHTRHILEECYVQRKKYQEVADELNISTNAVKKHIIKALQVIRAECNSQSANKL